MKLYDIHILEYFYDMCVDFCLTVRGLAVRNLQENFFISNPTDTFLRYLVSDVLDGLGGLEISTQKHVATHLVGHNFRNGPIQSVGLDGVRSLYQNPVANPQGSGQKSRSLNTKCRSHK